MYNTKKPTLFKDQWGDFRSWVVGVAVFVFIVGLTTGILVGINYTQQRACEEMAEEMGRNYDYGYYSGCLVEGDDGQFLPPENIREANHR